MTFFKYRKPGYNIWLMIGRIKDEYNICLLSASSLEKHNKFVLLASVRRLLPRPPAKCVGDEGTRVLNIYINGYFMPH